LSNPSRDNLDVVIGDFAKTLGSGSRVLDAGSANAPYAHHFKHCWYETADISGKVTYECDLCDIPIADNFFDAILSTQVLEHIQTPDKAVKELFRVLKPGGKLLLTVPFFYEEHLIPHDFFRFTQFGLKFLFEKAGFHIDQYHWLEGYSCTTYYYLTTLLKELEKLPDEDAIHGLRGDIERLQAAFLEREKEQPIYTVGFPKNYVYHCTKPERASGSRYTIDHVIRDRLTYLGPVSLDSISKCLSEVTQQNITGDFCEFGVGLGGSAILVASHLNDDRRFYGFGKFGMPPPPGSGDDTASHQRYEAISKGLSGGIGGDEYYGYREDLYDFVVQKFDDYGVSVDGDRINLVRGMFEESLPRTVALTQIAVAHIDCSWYACVRYCLDFSGRRVSLGGYIIIDDFNAWGGARRAVLDFLRENEDFDIIQAQPTAVLRRTRQS